MKIRLGFVSNSSSSSFVVLTADPFPNPDKKNPFLASEEDIKKLEEYGFEKTSLHDPFDYEPMCRKGDIKQVDLDEDEEHFYNMGYYISCNQDDVLYFLLKNNIPFKASCHYGHEYFGYKKDSDHFIKAYNFGCYMSMYEDDQFFLKNNEPIEMCSKEEYLEREKQWHDSNSDNIE